MNFDKSLFDEQDNILVAFSGGPDSVACLHYLATECGDVNVSAFYLHHGLRKEADEEVTFCKSFCEKLGVAFYTDKEDVSKIAHEQKKSLEQMGREVRYEKLVALAQEIDASKIITAHHLDDQVETVLMQVFSGTSGLRAGIAEIIEVDNVEVIRPLLHETKANILSYCEEKSLEYVIDASNLENDFKRNKLRNIILPMIRKTMNPTIEKAIERYKNVSDELSDFVDEQLDAATQELLVSGGYDLEGFFNLHTFIQKEFIKRLLVAKKSVFITTGLLEEVLEQLNSDKPNIYYMINKEVVLVKEYDAFNILSPDDKEFVFGTLVYGENYVSDYVINVYLDTMCFVDKGKKNSICLDADAVDITSLIIRNRKPGDSFTPLGMDGSKKLKDYFIDKKVPKRERDEVLIVEHSDGIIWVVGHEIDDNVKVTAETKSFLVIEVTPFRPSSQNAKPDTFPSQGKD